MRGTTYDRWVARQSGRFLRATFGAMPTSDSTSDIAAGASIPQVRHQAMNSVGSMRRSPTSTDLPGGIADGMRRALDGANDFSFPERLNALLSSLEPDTAALVDGTGQSRTTASSAVPLQEMSQSSAPPGPRRARPSVIDKLRSHSTAAATFSSDSPVRRLSRRRRTGGYLTRLPRPADAPMLFRRFPHHLLIPSRSVPSFSRPRLVCAEDPAGVGRYNPHPAEVAGLFE